MKWLLQTLRRMFKNQRKLPLSSSLTVTQFYLNGLFFLFLQLKKNKWWVFCDLEGTFSSRFWLEFILWLSGIGTSHRCWDASGVNISAVLWPLTAVWRATCWFSRFLCSVASKTKFFENASRHVGRYVKYLTSPVWLFHLITKITRGYNH